jgi:tRNA threonylcarbamoyladenosine biosynthesis protein TsaE
LKKAQYLFPDEIFIKNQQEMQDFARKFAQNFIKNHLINKNSTKIITLSGTLGSGKTVFAKNFISELTGEENDQITSPTFNIYLEYHIKNHNIYHFDLYRIKNECELKNIGFYDLLKDGICLIEWPEIAERYLPNDAINIDINIGKNEERIITRT